MDEVRAHVQFLQHHCRICGDLLSKGCRSKERGRQSITSFDVKGKLEHGHQSIPWQTLLLEVKQFAIDTSNDDPNIHPQKFCFQCYCTLRNCIINIKANHRIIFFKFTPHNSEDIMACVICKQHITRNKGGRKPKPNRGRKKGETMVACTDVNALAVMHAYAQPDESPNVTLAREIFLAKSAKDDESGEASGEASASCSQSPDVMNMLHVPVETVGSEEASEGVDGATDCNKVLTTPKLPRRTRGKGCSKTPMAELKSNYSRNRRLQPIVTSLIETVNAQRETLEDIWPHLTVQLGMQKAQQIKEPSPIESLAFKVQGGFTDNMYRFIHMNGKIQARRLNQSEIYAPLSAVKSVEVEVKPGFAKFELDPPDNVVFPSENHLSADKRCAPIDIMAGISSSLCTLPPNMIGVRYRYDKAVAQTLSEYQSCVTSALDKLSEENTALSATIKSGVILDAYFKDGADGLGDISQYKGKTLRVLPNNALRYVFSLMEISFTCSGTRHVLYKNSTPNSVKSCRTLLNAIADENDSISNAMCNLPIEKEKMALQGKVVNFISPRFSHSFKVHIFTTMVDEKFERHFSGLEPSSSNFACTVCYYNRATDKQIWETVPPEMKRTRADTEAKALASKDNEHHLTRAQKDDAAKGARAMPVMTFGTIMDSTHADINLSGSAFKTIYVREIARVYEWNERACMKEKLEEAVDRFDALVLQYIGHPKKLMQGGNYGRDLINISAIKQILSAANVPAERINAVERCLELYNRLRKVWRANFPESDCPEELKTYSQTAHELGQHLRDKFEYFVKWTPYLHKILAHVLDTIYSTPLRTCGGLAAEASEGTNKNFRKDRVFHSRQNLAYELEDNLRWSWLSTSFLLQEIVRYERRVYTCSICGGTDHNCRTCKYTQGIVSE